MNFNMVMAIIMGLVLLTFGIVLLVSKKKEAKNMARTTSNTSKETNAYKKNTSADVNKDDIFNFMEFDRIQDDMIIQHNGEKYTAVIKCKGINYALMSEVEQLAVEEGFMNFLNTLKFPVQLYVQAQSVNLKSNIAEYKEHMKGIYEEYDEVNSEYNALLNSLESEDEEIEEAEGRKNSVLNVLEYGQDIVRYVEKLALNKNMLQRSFYVLVSYYKSELSNAESFNKEELLDICYSELFTRVQSLISGLSMCSVNGTILESNDIAELLYSAYNRDDKNYLSVGQALESGFYRLYSTSEDALKKKQKRLIEGMRQEAEYKAVEALNRAIEQETLVTQTDAEDAYDQETSKQAIEIIKKERISDKLKQDAKKIIVDDYRKAKKERYEAQEQKIEKMREQLANVKQNEVQDVEQVKEDSVNEQQPEQIINSEENINSASEDDDSIV